MFGSLPSGANAYAKVGLETGVAAASPHKLIVMLFEGTLVAVNAAAAHLKAEQFEQKAKAISKAIQIIEEGLRASLDKDKGGELAANLDALYGYVVQRLLHANLRNDGAALQEVLALLADLKGAWEAIGPSARPAAAAAPRSVSIDALMPRNNTFVSA